VLKLASKKVFALTWEFQRGKKKVGGPQTTVEKRGERRITIDGCHRRERHPILVHEEKTGSRAKKQTPVGAKQEGG